MEDQERILSSKISEKYKEKKLVTPNEALELNLEDNATGNKCSYVDNYERMIDVMDVVFRYVFWKYNDFEDDYYKCWPYNDPSVNKLKMLADQRKYIENLWQDIKYFDWRLYLKEEEKLCIYYPNDVNLYKHMEAGTYRSLLYSYELSNFILSNDSSVSESYNHFLKKLNSIDFNLDKNTILWNPLELIEEIIEVFKYHHPEELILVEHFHTLYKIDIKEFEFGNNNKKVTGDLLMFTWKLLHVLGKIYQKQSWELIKNEEDNKNVYHKLIPFIEKNLLVELLMILTSYNETDCINAIELLQFNPVNKRLDLGLQPLIEIKNNKLIMIPTLCKNLNLVRLFESQMLQWNINLDGFKFEKELKNVLSDLNISVNSKKVNFIASDNKEVEYDIVFIFEDYLFIIEAKCLKQPYSSKDRFNAKKDIDKAVEQLRRRKDTILTDWDLFKNNVDIDLSIDPPPDNKIIPLVITNIFTFTGLEFGDILVSDYKALTRYLTGPEIFSIKYNPNDESKDKNYIGSIWSEDKPTPKELINFLKNPIALKGIINNLELEHNYLLPLDKGDIDNVISVLTYLLKNYDITNVSI